MSESKERESTSLARWDPFAELDIFGGWSPFRTLGGIGPRMRRLLEDSPRTAMLAPVVDVSESDDEYVVSAEIPGANKDDVSVEVNEGILSIRGEKKSEREEKKEKRHYVERSYGSFNRYFRLPSNANADRIDASFKDGVLTITIPKTEESKPKVVSVK